MPRPAPSRPRRLAPLLALLLLPAAACDDDLFGNPPWAANPDTVALFSLARPELNLASAFNFNSRFRVEVEASTASGSWDIAVDTQDGVLVFVTPRLLGIESEAGVTRVEAPSFEELREAPADTARYFNTEPVPIEVGALYAVRTLEVGNNFGQRCNYYAKVEPLSVDVDLGVAEFRYDNNPVCNNRDLVPPN